jgi:hypothetical protein
MTRKASVPVGELQEELEQHRNGQEESPSVSDDPERQGRKSILERMRESQPYEEDLEETEAKTSVGMYRPAPTDWFRVHPDPLYRTPAFLITVRHSRRSYVVFGEELQEDLRRRKLGKDVTIYTCMDRYGSLFLWEISNGPSEWAVTARRAAFRAQTVWTRMWSNHTLQRYQWEESTKIAPPQWGNKSFEAMIDEVFDDCVIESADHELIRALLGEA